MSFYCDIFDNVLHIGLDQRGKGFYADIDEIDKLLGELEGNHVDISLRNDYDKDIICIQHVLQCKKITKLTFSYTSIHISDIQMSLDHITELNIADQFDNIFWFNPEIISKFSQLKILNFKRDVHSLVLTKTIVKYIPNTVQELSIKIDCMFENVEQIDQLCDLFNLQLTHLNLDIQNRKYLPITFYNNFCKMKTLKSLKFNAFMSNDCIKNFGNAIKSLNILKLDFTYLAFNNFKVYNLLRNLLFHNPPYLKELILELVEFPDSSFYMFLIHCKLRKICLTVRNDAIINLPEISTSLVNNHILENITHNGKNMNIEHLSRNESYRSVREFATIMLSNDISFPPYVILWIIDWVVKNANKHHKRNIVLVENVRNSIVKVFNNRIKK